MLCQGEGPIRRGSVGVGQAKQSTGEPSGPSPHSGLHAAWGLQHQQVSCMVVQ